MKALSPLRSLARPLVSITIYDIAEKAHVSIATVSRVFNDNPRVSDETRERVLEVAHALGYEPHVSAQSLARRKTHLISAVIPVMTNYFFVEVLRGLQDRLGDSDFDLIVYASNELEDANEQLGRALQRGRSAGVLVFSMPITEDRVRQLQRSVQPAILVDCSHEAFDSISINNALGGYLATRHLIDLGHQRVGMIMANKGVPAAERRSGYERALREAGLPLDSALIQANIDPREHGYTEQAGFEAMERLLQLDQPPCAVFATSDIQALGALQAIKEAGLRVPHDIAVIGFDDIVTSRYVELSTLRQPMREMGALAVETVLWRLEHLNAPPSHTVFDPELIVRKTTRVDGHA